MFNLVQNYLTHGKCAMGGMRGSSRYVFFFGTYNKGNVAIILSALPRLAARTLLLVVLATARGCYTSLEQPSGSRMKVFSRSGSDRPTDHEVHWSKILE